MKCDKLILTIFLSAAFFLSLPAQQKSMLSGSKKAVSETARPGPTWQNPQEQRLRQMYEKAIRVASLPTTERIYPDLVPITPTNPSLTWNEDNTMVLMATWTKSEYYDSYKKGQPFNLYGETWLTAYPYVNRFLSDWATGFECDSASIGLRIRQLLGIPPNDKNNVLVSFYIRPEDMFRPCPDPEIYDRVCTTGIPLRDGKGEARAAMPGDNSPWPYCQDTTRTYPQVGSQFMQVKSSHLNWICNWWHGAYVQSELYDKYPWTALGYTYDWGAPAEKNGVGQSEFVAVKGAKVVMDTMIYPADVFCGFGK